MRKLVPLIGGILLGVGIGIVIFYGILGQGSKPVSGNFAQRNDPLPVPSLDAPAPDFELFNLEGDVIVLEDYKGKPILLNFWATWCGPCRLEMPSFQSRYEKLAGELAVIAINNDEDPDDVQAFVDEFGISFDVLLDPEAKIQHLYQVRGYPTTFLIDPDGVIRVRHIGLMSENQLEGYLKELGFGK